MPKLSELNFTKRYTSTLNPGPSTRDYLTLNHVRKATFSASALLPALTLPALSCVELHFKGHHRISAVQSYERPINSDKTLLTEFSELLSRSSSPLREVTLDNLLDISSACDLIQALPLTVDTFRITQCGYHESLFPLLTAVESSSSPLILPKLQYLRLALKFKSAIDTSSLKEMIRSRYRSPTSSLPSLRGVSIAATIEKDVDMPTLAEKNEILALSNMELHVSLAILSASAESVDWGSHHPADDHWSSNL
jgi:hypothetical protein